jgi:hypothetical protein
VDETLAAQTGSEERPAASGDLFAKTKVFGDLIIFATSPLIDWPWDSSNHLGFPYRARLGARATAEVREKMFEKSVIAVTSSMERAIKAIGDGRAATDPSSSDGGNALVKVGQFLV